MLILCFFLQKKRHYLRAYAFIKIGLLCSSFMREYMGHAKSQSQSQFERSGWWFQVHVPSMRRTKSIWEYNFIKLWEYFIRYSSNLIWKLWILKSIFQYYLLPKKSKNGKLTFELRIVSEWSFIQIEVDNNMIYRSSYSGNSKILT